jgi:hypothetical protein
MAKSPLFSGFVDIFRVLVDIWSETVTEQIGHVREVHSALDCQYLRTRFTSFGMKLDQRAQEAPVISNEKVVCYVRSR